MVANVGDCRCYQVADGYVSQISVDDHDPALGENVVTQSLGGPPRALDIHWLELPHAQTATTRYMSPWGPAFSRCRRPPGARAAASRAPA